MKTEGININNLQKHCDSCLFRIKLREEAEVIHLKLQITRILVHTLMRIIIQMIPMRLLELDFTIVRQVIKPCM